MIVDESGRKKIKADFFSQFLEEDSGSELYFLSFSMTVQESFRVFINPSIRLLLLIQLRVTRSMERPEETYNHSCSHSDLLPIQDDQLT